MIKYILIITFFLCSCTNDNKNNYGSKFTSNGLLSLKAGMSKKEVEQLIGLPYDERRKNEWRLTKKVKGKHSMVWVSFDDNEKLNSISVIYYDYFDDHSIYGLRSINGVEETWGVQTIEEFKKYQLY